MSNSLLTGRHIAPSILSADFSRLGQQVESVMAVGAKVIHIDVMDGQFVPPITIGPLVAESIREQIHAAGGILDVHLMIENPERQLKAFADAGADVITIHSEATPHVHYALKMIRELGCAAGVSICPGTPVEVLDGLQEVADLVLCMSVNPGWGGQKFIPESLKKIGRLRELFPENVAVEVDGGVDLKTASECIAAGANLLVAGSAVFSATDPAAAFAALSASF